MGKLPLQRIIGIGTPCSAAHLLAGEGGNALFDSVTGDIVRRLTTTS